MKLAWVCGFLCSQLLAGRLEGDRTESRGSSCGCHTSVIVSVFGAVGFLLTVLVQELDLSSTKTFSFAGSSS